MASPEINSILDSVKKKLGMDPDTMKEFDPDIIDAINMALNTLTQVGIGPSEGFVISGKNKKWSDFIGDDSRLNMVRTYVFTQVRLVFDPPQNSYLVTALKEKSEELLWRLNVQVDPSSEMEEE